MAEKQDEVLVQLATRIAKSLHREIKLYCVQNSVSVMDFISEAASEKLAIANKKTARRRSA